jgi:hypothetical protein
MLVVMVVGLIVAFEVSRRRRSVCLSRAEWHASQENQYVEFSRILMVNGELYRSFATDDRNSAAAETFFIDLRERHLQSALRWEAEANQADEDKKILLSNARIHAKLRDQYREAARYPWVVVAPDPAAPTSPEAAKVLEDHRLAVLRRALATLKDLKGEQEANQRELEATRREYEASQRTLQGLERAIM